MYSLNNQTKAQFMHREASYSTRGSRSGVNLLGWEEDEELSKEQERDCLVAKLKQLKDILQEIPKEQKIARKELGKEIHETNLAIGNLRKKKKAPGVQPYFMDVCREKLTKYQFDAFMTEAVKRMKAETNHE